ncbi:hypothetical protein ACFSCX_23515 [Bacillus salitolerans]|uniref:Uncharacterized protein n=1 Tax=Bacillus salitolerans TaxID=1437434 RepID=A0ABW4LX70_9BACI
MGKRKLKALLGGTILLFVSSLIVLMLVFESGCVETRNECSSGRNGMVIERLINWVPLAP